MVYRRRRIIRKRKIYRRKKRTMRTRIPKVMKSLASGRLDDHVYQVIYDINAPNASTGLQYFVFWSLSSTGTAGNHLCPINDSAEYTTNRANVGLMRLLWCKTRWIPFANAFNTPNPTAGGSIRTIETI